MPYHSQIFARKPVLNMYSFAPFETSAECLSTPLTPTPTTTMLAPTDTLESTLCCHNVRVRCPTTYLGVIQNSSASCVKRGSVRPEDLEWRLLSHEHLVPYLKTSPMDCFNYYVH